MILGLGIDIFDVARMQRVLARNEWRRQKDIFTDAEIGHCRTAPNPPRCLSGCFSAKEAATKALSMPVADLAMFREAEITPAGGHGYRVQWHGRLERASGQIGAPRVHVSITSNRTQSGAIIILES